jgi:hypothetical protein
MTDRLTLTRAFESAGMQSEAAERIATEIYDAIHGNVATKVDLQQVETALRTDLAQVKTDIAQLRTEVNARIDLIEHRLLTRLGGMIVVATGILIAIKYFG